VPVALQRKLHVVVVDELVFHELEEVTEMLYVPL